MRTAGPTGPGDSAATGLGDRCRRAGDRTILPTRAIASHPSDIDHERRAARVMGLDFQFAGGEPARVRQEILA
jgi:hypothetical protein